MFGLFGRKPKKPEDIIPELRRYVVQLQESTSVSSFDIADPMLNFGISLTIKDKGLLGLNSVLQALPSLIKEKQAALNLGSSVMDMRIPEQPQDQYNLIIDQLGTFATRFINQGYSSEIIGAATMNVWEQIVERLDKDNLLYIALLRKEYRRRYDEYRRQRLGTLATGDRCTEESINILLKAEAEGFTLTIERDGTFVLTKENVGSHYLRSNADIERFGRLMKTQQDAEEADRSPVERLVEQGHKHLQEQNLETAIGSYSAALRIKPDSADLYFHRGIAWSNTFYNRGNKADDLQKAIDDYARAIEIDPEYGEAYFQRAGLLSTQGQVTSAIEDYSKAIETGHQVSHSYYCRASLWQSTGEAGNAKAIADLDAAVRTGDRHNQYISLMARGEAHCKLGNFELAVADLTAAAAYYPTSPPGLYKQRGDAFRRLGRTREAIADLDQAIAMTSPLAGALFIADIHDQRGQCRMQLGESNLARQDFERAAQLKR